MPFFIQDQARKVQAGVRTDVSTNNPLMKMMIQATQQPGAIADSGNLKARVEQDTIEAFVRMNAESKTPLPPAQVAAHIADYYKAAVKVNEGYVKPAQMGFNPTKTYYAKLNLPSRTIAGYFLQDSSALPTEDDRRAKVDLLSPASLERWVAQTYAVTKSNKYYDDGTTWLGTPRGIPSVSDVLGNK
jgi:hypothetical protein